MRSLSRASDEGISDVRTARKHPELSRTLRVANLTSQSRSGRVLRAIVFRFPVVWVACERVVRSLLPPLERLKWHRLRRHLW